MTVGVDVVIPMRTPTMNEWQRMHWAKRRKIGRDIAWLLMAEIGRVHESWPLKRCKVHVERTSTREPDPDSLYAGLKPLLDALQPQSKRHPYGIGVIADDNSACIASLSAIHIPGKCERTRIIITPEQSA